MDYYSEFDLFEDEDMICDYLKLRVKSKYEERFTNFLATKARENQAYFLINKGHKTGLIFKTTYYGVKIQCPTSESYTNMVKAIKGFENIYG